MTARPGFVKSSLIVESKHGNRLSTLHGGLSASLVDTSGSLAVGMYGFWFTGVSTDISITFVKPAALGEEIIIESQVISMGT